MGYIENIEEPEWNSFLYIISNCNFDNNYTNYWFGTHLFRLKKWYFIIVRDRDNDGLYPLILRHLENPIIPVFTSEKLAYTAIPTHVDKTRWSAANVVPYEINEAIDFIKSIGDRGQGSIHSILFNPLCDAGGWGVPITKVSDFAKTHLGSNLALEKPTINQTIRDLIPSIRAGGPGCDEGTLKKFWSAIFSLDNWYISCTFDPIKTYGVPGFMGTPWGEFALPIFTDIESCWADCDRRLRSERIGYLPDPMPPRLGIRFVKEIMKVMPQLKSVIFDPGPHVFGMKISGMLQIWDILMPTNDTQNI